eukprot:TRINITY_DN3397_c2_g1_i1.p1 TRINITY_DN3397_c2_g1~~TRINITY_DN3397_c2_g1_i1.p1  ORF type:complete len:657 (+),score=104.34 TRINITY_DN3397_c2_g1_i1:231-1973(+)
MPDGASVSLWVYIWTCSCLVWGVGIMAFLQATRSLPQWLVNASVIYMTLMVIVPLDYNAEIYMQPAMWPFLVVAADVAILFRSPRWVSHVVTGIAVGYLFVQQAATSGLDIILIDPFNERGAVVPAACDCAEPPCNGSVVGGLIAFAAFATVFMLNYLITEGFAAAVRAEQKAMQDSVATAEEIAECLALFNLIAAEELLAGSRLPDKLRSAFDSILKNLHMYRPYLPQSCLPSADVMLMDDELSFPGSERLCTESPCASKTPSLPSRTASMSSAPDGLSRSHRRESLAREATFQLARMQARAVVQKVKITMVQTNLHDTMSWCDTPEKVVSTFSDVIGCAVAVFAEHRGTLDHVVGDKLTATFNAARRNVRHATAATDAAKVFHASATDLTGHGANVAVATGQVMCGDLGCETLRRFTLLGPLPTTTSALERVGRLLDVGIICNDFCAFDVSTEHELMCLPRGLLLRPCRDVRGDCSYSLRTSGDADVSAVDRAAVLYEVLPGDPLGQRSPSKDNDEWMYSLALAPAAQWEKYNAAMKGYIADGCASAAREAMKGDAKAEVLCEVLEAFPGGGPAEYLV